MKIRSKKIVEIICIYYFLFIMELLVLQYLPLPEEEIEEVMLSVILKQFKMLLFCVIIRKMEA